MDSLLFSYLLVILIGFLSARYLRPLVFIFLKKFSQWLPESATPILQEKAKGAYALLIFWAVCHIGFKLTGVEESWQAFIYTSLKVILAIALLSLSWKLIDILEVLMSERLERSAQKEDKLKLVNSMTRHLLPYSKRILKILISLIVILVFLQNSGFNVTSLLAGLGIGGVAVALAAKETLAHFFGGFSIIADKPFSVGDWIVSKDIEGTVEDIGFRSTKIKTFYDSVISVPNALIADSVIDNLGRRQSRRTRVTLDLTYDTSPEKVEAFVEGVKNIIESNSYTRKDYYQCYFSAYGPHSLQILLNFFLKVQDWDSELLQKQNIFLEILRLAKELEVDFAFPTQTLDVPALPEQGIKEKPQIAEDQLKKKAQAFGPKGSLSRPEGLGIYNPKK